MALTGEQLFLGFAKFLGEVFSSTTTSAGAADGTTLVDTGLQRYDASTVKHSYVLITSGTNDNTFRRVSSFSGSTIVVAPAFTAQVATSVTYYLIPHDPQEMLRALDRGRLLAYPDLAIVRMDETITSDGENKEIPIPSALRKGPVDVYQEILMSPTAGWNALSDSALNASSGNWTASGTTASEYEKNDFDLLVPRHETTCIKLVGDGTYSQVVADMASGMSAAVAAGRRLTFGAWVYQRATNGTATVEIVHDSATATSSVHGGSGWQLLEVTATIPSGNATTLTCRIDTGGAVTVFAEHAYLVFADRLPQRYDQRVPKRGIWRDGTNAEVLLQKAPPRGYQLRLIGRAPLTSLGDTVSTAFAASMEVDEPVAELLYAKAARALLIDEGMSSDKIEAQVPKIAEAEARYKDGAINWGYDNPVETKISGWWNELA